MMRDVSATAIISCCIAQWSRKLVTQSTGSKSARYTVFRVSQYLRRGPIHTTVYITFARKPTGSQLSLPHKSRENIDKKSQEKSR